MTDTEAADELDRQAEAHKQAAERIGRHARELRERAADMEEQAKDHLCRAIAAKEVAIIMRRTP